MDTWLIMKVLGTAESHACELCDTLVIYVYFQRGIARHEDKEFQFIFEAINQVRSVYVFLRNCLKTCKFVLNYSFAS